MGLCFAMKGAANGFPNPSSDMASNSQESGKQEGGNRVGGGALTSSIVKNFRQRFPQFFLYLIRPS